MINRVKVEAIEELADIHKQNNKFKCILFSGTLKKQRFCSKIARIYQNDLFFSPKMCTRLKGLLVGSALLEIKEGLIKIHLVSGYIQEKGQIAMKKPIYKKWWFWVAIGVVIYLIYTTYEQYIADPISPTESLQSLDTKASLDGDVLIDSRQVTKEDNIERIITMFSTIYLEEAIVSYDQEEDAILLMPTDDRIVTTLNSIIAGQTPRDDWDYYAEDVRHKSISVASLVGNHTRVITLNPQNPQSAFLITQNGEVLYNIVDDMLY